MNGFKNSSETGEVDNFENVRDEDLPSSVDWVKEVSIIWDDGRSKHLRGTTYYVASTDVLTWIIFTKFPPKVLKWMQVLIIQKGT